MVNKTPHPSKPGYYLIQHPDTPMSDEQRAWEMWAVHPSDLEVLEMTREEFFLAHLRAAKRPSVCPSCKHADRLDYHALTVSCDRCEMNFPYSDFENKYCDSSR